MKKTVFIFIFIFPLLFAACNNGAEKPGHLLSKGEMEDILYDVALLQAMNSFAPGTLEDYDIKAGEYIYKKYKIDSLTFVQNHDYYAADAEQYRKMQEKVVERLKKEKPVEDTLKKRQPDVKKDKPAKKVYDNITSKKDNTRRAERSR